MNVHLFQQNLYCWYKEKALNLHLHHYMSVKFSYKIHTVTLLQMGEQLFQDFHWFFMKAVELNNTIWKDLFSHLL